MEASLFWDARQEQIVGYIRKTCSVQWDGYFLAYKECKDGLQYPGIQVMNKRVTIPWDKEMYIWVAISLDTRNVKVGCNILGCTDGWLLPGRQGMYRWVAISLDTRNVKMGCNILGCTDRWLLPGRQGMIDGRLYPGIQGLYKLLLYPG
jgi:hypothetical protein